MPVPQQPDGATTTPPAEAGHTDTHAADLAKAPDPMLAAFGGTPEDGAIAQAAPPTAAREPAAKPTTPPATPPAGHTDPAARTQAPAEPPAESPQPPDFNTASPEELRAWARQHPSMAKAMGLEVRDRIQRYSADLNREQQARQQAEQAAARAQQQQQLQAEYYDAFYDDDHPRHWDAVKFFAEQGIQPVEVERVIGSPVVQGHISRVAQQVSAEAMERATQAAVASAAEHPAFTKVNPDALEAAWQETSTVPDFYERAFKEAGWLSPEAAAEFRKAAEEDARTRVFGKAPPAEGSVVRNGHAATTSRPVPVDKRQINPAEWFASGLQPAGSA